MSDQRTSRTTQDRSALPPGQQLAAATKWPVVGEREPAPSPAQWTVAIDGLVEQACSWTLFELQQLPQVERRVDVHCVTRWSKPQMQFRGVLLETLLAEAKPQSPARFVSFVAHSPRQHSTSLPLETCRQLGVLLALEADGQPLSSEHGGPVRSVTPGRYFYKSLKWLRRIELLEHDRLGFWEAEAGYHNEADPWLEQRYLAPALDRREAARLLAERNLQGRDLRSINAAGHQLRGLQAAQALLRDADFRNADLQEANFDGANLSNAHMQGANLLNASLRGADLEGTSFEGADLRGADFTGASLFGATLWSPNDPASAARIDAATTFDAAAFEQLLPAQAELLRRMKSEEA